MPEKPESSTNAHGRQGKGPVVCIIPGRGGSKRIANKNLWLLNGRPLIAHSILHARASRTIEEIYVSTDDVEIARVAEQYGAAVIDRPEDLSTDTATSESALAHALEWRLGKGMEEARTVVFLQCTSPIRRPDDIDRAVAQFERDDLDSLFSATPNSRLIWGQRPDGQPVSINYDYKTRQREQDMETQFRENGSIYVFSPWVLRQQGNRLGGKIGIYPMDYWSSFQLDEPEHAELLEFICRREAFRIARPGPGQIDLAVFDFDGVMTDNTLWLDEEGRESVRCNRADGLGISHLKAAGIKGLILSMEKNPVVAARASKLNLPCAQGIDDKAGFLADYLNRKGISPEKVAYVGNDINDLGCFGISGFAIAVADAVPEVLAKADHVLRARGGFGAVREACDLLVSSNKAEED
jgi:N-acylneuraminate cytidylyltransferase